MYTVTVDIPEQSRLGVTFSAKTIENLQKRLKREGYTGGTERVLNEQGFTVGWVSAETWRAS